MKVQIFRKIAIGLALSMIPIIGVIEGGVDASYILPMLFIIIWNVGQVYAAPYYIKKIENRFSSILKLSIISYLAIGRNAVMTVVFIVYLIYLIVFGWITGWIQLIKDIIT